MVFAHKVLAHKCYHTNSERGRGRVTRKCNGKSHLVLVLALSLVLSLSRRCHNFYLALGFWHGISFLLVFCVLVQACYPGAYTSAPQSVHSCRKFLLLILLLPLLLLMSLLLILLCRCGCDSPMRLLIGWLASLSDPEVMWAFFAQKVELWMLLRTGYLSASKHRYQRVERGQLQTEIQPYAMSKSLIKMIRNKQGFNVLVYVAIWIWALLSTMCWQFSWSLLRSQLYSLEGSPNAFAVLIFCVKFCCYWNFTSKPYFTLFESIYV